LIGKVKKSEIPRTVRRKKSLSAGKFFRCNNGGIHPPRVMNRLIKPGIASLKALGAFLVLGAVAHGSLPYLPLLGPPPLRIQAVKSPPPNNAVVKFVGSTVTNLTAMATTAAIEAKSTAGSTNPAIVSLHQPALIGIPDSDKALGDTFSATVFTLPTPNLLGISPEMLATYFRPVQRGTNVVPMGLLPITFMPPLPPDKSSHAEYNVK
jgi:hypothetical protein